MLTFAACLPACLPALLSRLLPLSRSRLILLYFMTHRLDDKGRQVDADGKVVRMGPVLTAKANRLGNKAHNPYLQHKTVGAVQTPNIMTSHHVNMRRGQGR